MQEVKINVFEFKELNKEIKKEVENKIREKLTDCAFEIFTDDAKHNVAEKLKEAGCENIAVKNVYYSLSYCQGDGLCFVGSFTYKGFDYEITHKSRECYAESVDIEQIQYDETEINEEALSEFKAIYLKICAEMEKCGYECYNVSEEEIKEYAEQYLYYEDGRRYEDIAKN